MRIAVLCLASLGVVGCQFNSVGGGGETGTEGGGTSDDAGDGDGTGGDGTSGDGTTGDGTTGDGDGTSGDGTSGDGTSGDGTSGDGDCGNGVIDAGEDCDLSDLGGSDCTSLGFVVGSGLACTSACTFDISGCTAFCGNNTVEPGESCEDGNLDPDDGCDECRLTGVSCASRIPIPVGFGAGADIAGTTTGGGSHASDSCDGESNSADRLFVLEPAGAGFVTVWLDRAGTPFDSILYTLEDCQDPGSPGLCVDLSAPTPSSASGEVLSFWSVPGQQTTVVVDGFDGAGGAFTLHARLSAGTCGDPVVLPFWPGGVRPNVGRTTTQPDGPPASCGGSGAGEVVYRVDAMEPGSVNVIASAGGATFPIMGSLRSTCDDPSTELACDSSGDVVLGFSASPGSSTFVIVDGIGASSGDYGFSVGG